MFARNGAIGAAASLALLAGCATTQGRVEPSRLKAEARAFMEEYGADLRSHNRAAIADRYDPDGAWFVINGRSGFETAAKIREGYLTEWRGPNSFAWHDLAFDVVGPDAVAVIGAFDWGRAEGVRRYSYTGLLKRKAGTWRIRIEDETPVPAPKP